MIRINRGGNKSKMNCAFKNGRSCMECELTNQCPIYKEWRELTKIGFKDNKTNELIELVKHVLGLINIISKVDLKNKQNQEQLFDKICELQDKLTRLKGDK